jgi:CCR4-NOT transcription complex subunit 1
VALTTYDTIRVLLTSELASIASEESPLRNLGALIGALTIAENKPLLQKHLDLKEVLCAAHRSGRLIEAIPFVTKILESCSESTVFKPPNPWLRAIMALLVELHSLSGLELTLKSEIKAVFSHLGQDLAGLTPSHILQENAITVADTDSAPNDIVQVRWGCIVPGRQARCILRTRSQRTGTGIYPAGRERQSD